MIRDIIVDSDPSGFGQFGFENKVSFGTTPQGFPDNIRIMYGLNSSGKTSMLKTIHELFREDEEEELRGTHIWHNRIVDGRFEMVEENAGENPEKKLDQIIKEMRVESSSVLEFNNRITAGRTQHFTGLYNILTFPIDSYPEESRVELRKIGDGTYSWACHMDWERETLEFETVTELKARLRAEDLPLGGNKSELVDRLCASDTKHSMFEGAQAEEYLFIDLRVMNKKVTRILEQNNLENPDRPEYVLRPHSEHAGPLLYSRAGRMKNNTLMISVLGEKITIDRVFDFPQDTKKDFLSLLHQSVPDSEVPGIQQYKDEKKNTANALKKELKKLGLPSIGTKKMMMGRIRNNLRRIAFEKSTHAGVEYGEGQYHEFWDKWSIHEEIAFPGLTYEETTQLFRNTLPFTWDELAVFSGDIEVARQNYEASSDESEKADFENEIEKLTNERSSKFESLQELISSFSPVLSLKLQLRLPQFEGKSGRVWGVNGFRIITDLFQGDGWREFGRTVDFEERKLSRFATVMLDVDRVSIGTSPGGSLSPRESSEGLESKISEFWREYPDFSLYEEDFRMVRKIFDDELRNMDKAGKQNIDFRFHNSTEYMDYDDTYLDEELCDIMLGNLEGAEDEFTRQFYHIRRWVSENLAQDHNDPDSHVRVVYDNAERRAFSRINTIAGIIEPAMSFLRSARKFTGYTLTDLEGEGDYPFLEETRAPLVTNAKVPASSLSSGQKHLFSMLLPIATAFFRVAGKKSYPVSKNILTVRDMVPDHILVMIDEPEISLHVNWQEDLVQAVEDALRESSESGILPPVSVIFATHSPSILGNHLDRSSCLGPPGESYGE